MAFFLVGNGESYNIYIFWQPMLVLGDIYVVLIMECVFLAVFRCFSFMVCALLRKIIPAMDDEGNPLTS